MGRGHHHHGHHHGHGHGGEGGDKALWVAFVFNALFAIVELVGGYFLGSMAILADAVHDAGDALSLGLAVFLHKKSKTGPVGRYSYGLRRLSLLSAVLTSVFILVSSFVVAWHAWQRLGTEQTPNGLGVVLLAIVGLVVNVIPATILRKGQTMNERVVSWHLFEDAAGWAIVLLGGIAMWLWGWGWLDSYLALGLAAFVSFNVVRMLWTSVQIFLQMAPVEVRTEAIEQEIRSISGVIESHDFHLWSLDGARHVLSVHLIVENSSPEASRRIREEVRRLVRSHGDIHVTIEIEDAKDACEDRC